MMRPKTILVMVASVFIFGAACYLMAFGGAIACCSPVLSGTGFWHREKLSYGLVPICISVALFALAARLWAQRFTRRRNAWLFGCATALFCVVADSAMFLKFRGHQDDAIKLAWKGESGSFDWGSGEVKLPAGFTYNSDTGMDTFVGHFTSRNGRLVIDHDIGELAGEHGGMGETERLVDGSRVRIALRIRSDTKPVTTFFSKVSFPDNGCANFYLESTSEDDAAAIEFIAQSFRPKSLTPSWIRPLLPEIIRMDCRYKFRLPVGF